MCNRCNHTKNCNGLDIVFNKTDRSMSYEPGSQECRLLIEAKESLLNAMKAIGNLDDMAGIQNKLLEIYTELEDMHEARRSKEKKVAVTTDNQ